MNRLAGLLALGIGSCGNAVHVHFWGGAFLPDKLPLFLIGIGSFHLYTHAESLKGFRHRLNVVAALIAATLAVGWHRLALLIWLVVFGGVLADGNNPSEQFRLRSRRLLLQPALQFIGKISYLLYLAHWPVIILLTAGLISWRPDISSWTMLVAGLPVI